MPRPLPARRRALAVGSAGLAFAVVAALTITDDDAPTPQGATQGAIAQAVGADDCPAVLAWAAQERAVAEQALAKPGLSSTLRSQARYNRDIALAAVATCTTTTTTETPTTAPAGTTTTTVAPTPDTTAPPGTATATCPAYPAFPDANCTGWRHTGVTLSPYTGPLSITTDGTVIDGKDVGGDLLIRAADVTIKRSKINGSVNLGYAEVTNVVMEDVEIDAGNTTFAAVGAANFTCRRCDIHGGGQGINGYSFTVEDSWIHDLYGTGTVHSEAILGYNGDIVVRHNRLSGNYNPASGGFDPADGGMSSAVSFYTHGGWGPMHDVVLERNLLSVGTGERDYAGYCLYGGGDLMSNGVFRDNVFANHPAGPGNCGYYGTAIYLPAGPGSVWAGNRLADGTPV